MNRGDVLFHLCALMSSVRNRVFDNKIPFDCFCGYNDLADLNRGQFDMAVINFVYQAVDTAILQRQLEEEEREETDAR
jgi:hypothetical protein